MPSDDQALDNKLTKFVEDQAEVVLEWLRKQNSITLGSATLIPELGFVAFNRRSGDHSTPSVSVYPIANELPEFRRRICPDRESLLAITRQPRTAASVKHFAKHTVSDTNQPWGQFLKSQPSTSDEILKTLLTKEPLSDTERNTLDELYFAPDQHILSFPVPLLGSPVLTCYLALANTVNPFAIDPHLAELERCLRAPLAAFVTTNIVSSFFVLAKTIALEPQPLEFESQARRFLTMVAQLLFAKTATFDGEACFVDTDPLTYFDSGAEPKLFAPNWTATLPAYKVKTGESSFDNDPLSPDTLMRSTIEGLLTEIIAFMRTTAGYRKQLIESAALEQQANLQARIANDLGRLLDTSREMTTLAFRIQSELDTSKTRFLALREELRGLFDSDKEMEYGVKDGVLIFGPKQAPPTADFTILRTIHSPQVAGSDRSIGQAWEEYRRFLTVAGAENGFKQAWLRDFAAETFSNIESDAFTLLKLLLHRPHHAWRTIFEPQLAFAVRHATADWDFLVPVETTVGARSVLFAIEQGKLKCADWLRAVEDWQRPNTEHKFVTDDDTDGILQIPGEIGAADVLGALMRLCEELKPGQGDVTLSKLTLLADNRGAQILLECTNRFKEDKLRLGEGSSARGLRSCLLILCRAMNQRQPEVLVENSRPKTVPFLRGLKVFLYPTQTIFSLGFERKLNEEKEDNRGENSPIIL